jgi:hypothetical protein
MDAAKPPGIMDRWEEGDGGVRVDHQYRYRENDPPIDPPIGPADCVIHVMIPAPSVLDFPDPMSLAQALLSSDAAALLA